jgi:Ala-tRNA(Pro) deacylase
MALRLWNVPERGNAMPASEQDLLTLLDSLSIAHATHRHAPVFTVAESQELRGALPGGHSKNLFLKDKKDRYLLAVVDEARRVELKALGRAPGLAFDRLSFASAERLAEVLGISPGSVTPFALMNARGRRDLTVVLDAALMRHNSLNFHPLHNAATTAIAADDLIAFIRHCGFAPIVLDFDAL